MKSLENIMRIFKTNSQHNEIPRLNAINKKSQIRHEDNQENQVRRFIFRTFLELGRAPKVEEIRSALKLSLEEVTECLESLKEKDLVLIETDTQNIIAACPFSVIPTPHRVVLKSGKEIYALCAFDALSIPFMLDQDAVILSLCHYCKKEIKIEVKDGRITPAEPHTTLIWVSKRIGHGCTVPIKCSSMNFFCSPTYLSNWQAENPNEEGYIFNVFQPLKSERLRLEVY
jgi:hypothetical protein